MVVVTGCGGFESFVRAVFIQDAGGPLHLGPQLNSHLI
jgi:hypothetical protein